jgi:hypothetical protein
MSRALSSGERRPVRIASEVDLAYKLGHKDAVAEGYDWYSKSPLAVDIDAVEHQPQREQRDVRLGHVDDDPGKQEGANYDDGD